MNTGYELEDLLEEVESKLKVADFARNRDLYIRICKSYDPNLIRRALSELRADAGEKAIHKGKVFVEIMHRIAHESGYIWLKDCGDNCKYKTTD